MNAVFPDTASASVFDDRNRERAHPRLDVIDILEAGLLFDALSPSEHDKRLLAELLRCDDLRLETRHM